ncbi:cation channel family protein [Stylonychia lemnae]|uniref:Cation channel family protein n=1 Tax=Stylonychia lemnae TaxID=5949 RepID=A0A078AAU0_STYLE|nr:cation channel family protein [Stylonychia lemnae]|eukprot:CDW78727.1 cation channel family protein [Stylonychia lemnae]
MMTDRQILKRLNNEIKRSRVFKSVNFTKLPDVIKRKEGQEIHIKKKPKKNPKKKPNKNNLLLEHEEEEVSDTSQDLDGLEDDIYIDRDFQNYDEVFKAKAEALNRKIDNVEWSGQDIMTRFDPYKAKIALDSLNQIRIWPHGCYGYFKRWRTLLKNVMKHSLIENLMTLCVFANTIILSMDRYGIDADTQSILSSFNTFFTIVFSIEMFLKIAAIGLVKWLRDKMNYMDGFIVILSLVELVFMSGSGAFSAFRSIRMLRTLRVLRVARLLRGMKSMINIIQVIQRSLSSFVYLGMLLFLFIFIFALLGMQLFGGNFKNLQNASRYNFDSFNQAFVTSFILLSMENWNTVLFNAMQSDVNKAISVVYFISCIFVGNFMLLNLFLAILLDAFTSVDEEDHDTPEKRAEREKQKRELLKEKAGEELITGLEEIDGQDNNHGGAAKKKKKKKKKKAKPGEAVETNILDESVEIDMEALELKKQQTIREKSRLFEGVGCERSIYMFTKTNPIRIYSYKIVTNNKFENFILVLIILSSIKLIYDTYLFNAPDDDPQVVISGKFDLAFTVLFTGECVLKCIAYGFIQDQNSYLRETWSQMDFFIVVTSLIDATFSGLFFLQWELSSMWVLWLFVYF